MMYYINVDMEKFPQLLLEKKKSMFSSCTAVFPGILFFILLTIPSLLCPVLDNLSILFLFLSLLLHFAGAHPSVTSLRGYIGGKILKTLHF